MSFFLKDFDYPEDCYDYPIPPVSNDHFEKVREPSPHSIDFSSFVYQTAHTKTEADLWTVIDDEVQPALKNHTWTPLASEQPEKFLSEEAYSYLRDYVNGMLPNDRLCFEIHKLIPHLSLFHKIIPPDDPVKIPYHGLFISILFILKGHIYDFKGRNREADQEYALGIKKMTRLLQNSFPHSYTLCFYLNQVHSYLGNQQESLSALNAAIAINPFHPRLFQAHAEHFYELAMKARDTNQDFLEPLMIAKNSILRAMRLSKDHETSLYYYQNYLELQKILSAAPRNVYPSKLEDPNFPF